MEYEVLNTSTQFGWNTPHGFGVPHKYPTVEGESLTDLFMGLINQLYPTGRAFYIPENGIHQKLHEGINKSFSRLLQEAKLVIDKSLPDNDNFTEEHALFLEKKFGLFTGPAITLEERKKAIARKMAYPSGIIERQSKNFIEDQLRLSGFDVYVYENGFEEDGNLVYKTPDEIIALNSSLQQHGDFQHGSAQHGSTGYETIANTIVFEEYSVGQNLWSTFFISGSIISEGAEIPEDRKKEFIELILKLKPAHTVAFPIINYV